MNKRPSMFLAQPGQSVTEYSIVIGLVAILVLPVLTNFGAMLHTAFASSAYTPPLASKASKTALNASTKLSKYATAENLGPYQGTYDAKTGQITYQIPESMGGGSITTSVDGATSGISQSMLSYIQSWRGANGEAAPSELMGMVTKLSQIGEKMAAAQAQVNKENEGCAKIGCANAWGLIYLTQEYNNEFKSVMAKTTQMGSGYQEVQEVINGYSGVISSINYSNYLQGSYQYSSGINQEAYNLVEGNSHFGKTVRLNVSKAETPVLTHYASKRIDRSVKR